MSWLDAILQAVMSSHMNRRVQNFDLLMTRRIRSILLVSPPTPRAWKHPIIYPDGASCFPTWGWILRAKLFEGSASEHPNSGEELWPHHNSLGLESLRLLHIPGGWSAHQISLGRVSSLPVLCHMSKSLFDSDRSPLLSMHYLPLTYNPKSLFPPTFLQVFGSQPDFLPTHRARFHHGWGSWSP